LADGLILILPTVMGMEGNLYKTLGYRDRMIFVGFFCYL